MSRASNPKQRKAKSASKRKTAALRAAAPLDVEPPKVKRGPGRPRLPRAVKEMRGTLRSNQPSLEDVDKPGRTVAEVKRLRAEQAKRERATGKYRKRRNAKPAHPRQHSRAAPLPAPQPQARQHVLEEVPSGRDFVKVAIDYARRAIADKGGERFGKWMRLAASRFLHDLDRARTKKGKFTFSDEWATRACQFIERLPHVEGRWDTWNITLHPAHVFFVVNVFGFRNTDGTRRFTTALLAVARKNAKSTLAAGVLLACICLEEEQGPQGITAATTGSQARIVFNIAKRMVDMAHKVRDEYGLSAYANSIVRWPVGGSIKPINAKASTQDGLNPSTTVLDEIHAHKTHDLLNVLQSAAGARVNPLWVYTTTEGYESPGPWPELRKFAQQLLEDVFKADHFFALIYALDDEEGTKGEPGYRPADDDFDKTRWIKANPLLDVNPVLMRELEKAAIDARQMPGRHAEFKIKRLNRQSSTPRGWIRIDKWKACGGPVDLEWLKPYRCWGALDLASVIDFCSLRLLWNVDGHYYTWGRRWVPAEAVKSRTARGAVPYAAWVESGYLEMVEGGVVPHELVEEAVLNIKTEFNLQSMGYDPWNAAQIAKKLKDQGVQMEQFIQGAKSYHPAMKEFERAYVTENLSHAGDPVLTWCASNIVVRGDANQNMAPDRQRSSDKIDDMVALLMCFGQSLKTEQAGGMGLFFV